MPTEARGVRLHPELWELIEEAARSHKMTANAYLALRLSTLFDFDPEVHKLPRNGQKDHVRFTDA